MKKILLLSFLVLSFSCVNSQQKNINNSFKNFIAEDFHSALINNKGIILDVRTLEELNSGIIPGASTINFYDSDFEKKISKIQKDKIVYVYCRSGGRSAKAAQLLIDLGQKEVVNLEGGIMSWKKLGYDLESYDNKSDDNIKEFTKLEFSDIISNNDLVLVNFHTLWCVPCRNMAPIIDELEKKYLNKIYIARVDLDKAHSLENEFDINAVPTLILFKGKEIVWRRTGVVSKKELTGVLDNQL